LPKITQQELEPGFKHTFYFRVTILNFNLHYVTNSVTTKYNIRGGGRMRENDGGVNVIKIYYIQMWLMPAILATQEAKIRRLTGQSHPKQIVRKTLSQKKKKKKKKSIIKKGWWSG
jgi:hypothetical protein